MTASSEPARAIGRRGAFLVAVAAALIVALLAFAFFGLTVARMPFAVIAVAGIAAAALYGYLMWQAMAVRADGVSLSGALLAGVGGPLVGAFLLDVLQSVYAGDGATPCSSLLLAYWPVGVVALILGGGAALVAAALVRHGLAGRNRP